ncbi:MAG: hypothetical protein JSR69_02550 [Proteobacteria bacterium]|nr:hypothetical protein [Pseudomonadota bacterium]
MYSFSPYMLTVVSQRKLVDLNSMGGSAGGKVSSIFDLFEDFFKKQSSSSSLIKAASNRVIRYSKVERDKDGSVYGIVETGEYGYSQSIVDASTGYVSYNKKKHEAGLIPFFMKIAPSDQPTKALLVSQKFRTLGVKTELYGAFGAYVRALNPDWTLKLEKIVPSELINKYLKDGTVKTIRFITHEKPSDVAEALSNAVPDEASSGVELVVKAKRGRSLGSSVLNWYKNKTPISSLVTLPQMKYSEIKVDVSIGGKKKTLDLTSMHKTGAVVDVTNELTFDAKGHPTVDSLLVSSKSLIDGLKGELG